MTSEIKAFKTRIYPTKNQIEYFHKAFGIRRFIWNYALDEYLKGLNSGNIINEYDMKKRINNGIVKSKDYVWLSDINSMVRQESLKDLYLSIKKYHTNQRKARLTTNNINTEKYKPKFKSKKRDTNSFRYNNKGNPFKIISNKKFRLTTIKSPKNALVIKCAESITFLKNYKFCEITILLEAGKYYMIVTYEKNNHNEKCNTNKSVGIDMGVKTMLTCYDSERKSIKYHYPKSLYKQEKHTEKCHKILSNKKYGSNRYKKYLIRLQKSYQRENNIKKEFREQTTTMLCKNYKVIKIEGFNTKINTLNNINRALSRLGKYIFIERLKQKADLYGCELIFISGKATTQTCSNCNHRLYNEEKLSLDDRIYSCKECGLVLDRDINSAINILKC